MVKAAVHKSSPFKVREHREEREQPQRGEALSPPKEVAKAVDAFREAQDQAKYYEGEATVQKDIVLSFAEEEQTRRLLHGTNKSFRILGNEAVVTFVVVDSGAGLTEEDVSAFAKEWGREAAEALIERDYGSLRVDARVLEENYDMIVEALGTLPKNVSESLFKPMLMRARPGAAVLARSYAKSADELRELLKRLKIKSYLR